MTSGSRSFGLPCRTKVASTSKVANNWSATALSCPTLLESLVLTPSIPALLLQLVHERLKFGSGIPFAFKYESICFVDNVKDICFSAGQFSRPTLRFEDCDRAVLPHKCP